MPVRASFVTLCAILLAGCGARSSLSEPGAGSDAGSDTTVVGPECAVPEDCPGAEDRCRPVRCRLPEGVCEQLPEVVCDDLDPCTEDRCVPETGACSFEPLSFDLDNDGFRGPRAGYAPGEPGACGDDCDDTSPLAYPGGQELCDGLDNDCNGIVDDGASFVPADPVEILISEGKAPAQPTGFGWSGDPSAGYLCAYTGSEGGKTRVFLQRLSPAGELLDPPKQLTLVQADAGGGVMVWTGDRYGIAWSDRRFGDYEVFFNLADPYGNKLIPDVRLSNASGFSVYPSIVFDGTHFVVAWQDERTGSFRIYGQRIGLDGSLKGTSKEISSLAPAESPFLAAGDHNLGLVWVAGGTEFRQIAFRTLDQDLEPASDPVALTAVGDTGVYPTLVFHGETYLAAWYDPQTSPTTIYGTVLDEQGQVITPATPIATTPKHARYPWLLPLGDRVLVVFSDDHDGNEGYELYAKMLTANLEPASPDVRITTEPGHSIYPIGTFGPSGDVGIVFRDDRLVEQHVFFTRLSCVIPEG